MTLNQTPGTVVGKDPKLGTDWRGHAEPGATGIAALGSGMMKTVGATTTLTNADNAIEFARHALSFLDRFTRLLFLIAI